MSEKPSSVPPVVETKPGTARSDASWRSGDLKYDHSQDLELAAAGDKAAQARLRTKSDLELAKLANPD